MTYKVVYIIGSLSSTSINRKLVGAMIADAPKDLEFVEANFFSSPVQPRSRGGLPAGGYRLQEDP